MKKAYRAPWPKFVLYLVVVILLNLVSASLFIRFDLTKNRVFSLSRASIEAVSSLEEPLTIKAFFSENLPQPYGNLQQELSDLLEGYALKGNKYFNYTIHTINREETSTDKGRNVKKLAEDYSIYPIQIQNIEKDEITLQNAYMGLVLVHGNMMETIPSLGSVRNLEYSITSRINKISDKTARLLGLDQDIAVKLFLSSALVQKAQGLGNYTDSVEAVVDDLNEQNYNRLKFSSINPDQVGEADLGKYNLNALTLASETSESGRSVYAGLVVELGDDFSTINLLRKDLFGYTIVSPEDLKQPLDGIVEKLLGVNQAVGYLADHGAPPLYQNPYAPAQNQTQALAVFNRLASENYTVNEVLLTLKGIPEDLKTLLIVSPRQKFSNWDLFQIDQFIMRGNSVAFFIDTYDQVMPQGNQNYGQPPVYVPRETGLEKLLEHYGLAVKQSYVLDENSFIQRRQTRDGGFSEVPIYFAPQLSAKEINNRLPFLKNIKGLIMLNVSPLDLQESEKRPGLQVLLSSSDKAWEMSKDINLYNPMMITPPEEWQRASFPLAALFEGNLRSYFSNRPIPEEPILPSEAEGQEDKQKQPVVLGENAIAGNTTGGKVSFISETQTGRICVIGSSTVLSDSLLDPEGISPNSMFVMNLLDYMNGKEDFAIMRSKGQSYNPLDKVQPILKAFIKSFTIAGLPVLVIVAGIFVWLGRIARKKRIGLLFQKREELQR
ncbi:MAG TPA: ABC transporter permease [bacterium]|nr:ABC transporter permease [bacterium]